MAIEYLRQRGKAGTWSFYRRVPGDVRLVVGKVTWEKSLHTSDERQARRLVRALADKTDAEIEGARKVLKGVPAIDEAGGLDAFRSEIEDDVKQHRFLSAAAELREIDTDELLNRLQHTQERMDRAAARAELAELRNVIAEKARVLKSVGLEIDAADALARGAPGLTDALEAHVKAKELPEQTRRQYAYAVRRFTELHGELTLVELTRDHLREFGEVITGLPVTSGEVLKLPIREAIEAGRDEGLPTITAATRAKHLTAIRTLTRYALGEGMIEVDPFAGFKLLKPRQKHSAAREEKRLPFDKADLTAIFTALRTRHNPTSDDFWIPHVALYQGARLEEISQLETADVKNLDGVWCLDITDAGDVSKKLKNEPSLRTIPIHPKLIELGFLDHVGKGGRVFSALKPDRRGRMGGPYGKRFARLLRNVAMIGDTRKTFHSFRHTWTDAARDAGVPLEIRHRLAGREVEGAGSEKGYGTGVSPAVLLAELRKVDPLR